MNKYLGKIMQTELDILAYYLLKYFISTGNKIC